MKHRHNRPRRRIIAAVFSLTAGLLLAPVAGWAHENQTPAAEGSAHGPYVFGVVPQFESRKLHAIWQPLLREVAKRTGIEIDLAPNDSIPEFERDFAAGRFDFAYMNPYHALMAFGSQGYLPIIHDGSAPLFGILVVPKDSPIRDVMELNGSRIAFPAPNALGASLLMRTDLARLHGVSFEPTYKQTHSSVYLHVIKGIDDVRAGGGVMGTFKSQKPEIRDQLRILYQTRPMPRHPIVAHPRVPAEVVRAVTRAFLDLGAEEAGSQMLRRVPIQQVKVTSLAEFQPMQAWGLDAFVVRD
ncbi:MAG: phosphate/phosphite/phosphonate ABC transporter substrate-binding protein [Rhodospirillales bacterium]